MACCSAFDWPRVAAMSSMLDLVKVVQSGSVSPVVKIPPANVLHHSFDASRCAGSIIVAHISGDSALDLLLSLYINLS